MKKPTRYAIIQGQRATDAKTVANYLPGNYKVLWAGYFADGQLGEVPTLVIGGIDDHGWTLDDYVIPRLGSGLIGAKEIDKNHPLVVELNTKTTTRTLQYRGDKEWVDQTLTNSFIQPDKAFDTGRGCTITEIERVSETYLTKEEAKEIEESGKAIVVKGKFIEEKLEAEEDNNPFADKPDDEFFKELQAEQDKIDAEWQKKVDSLPHQDAKDLVVGLLGLIVGPSLTSVFALAEARKFFLEGGGRESARPYVLKAISFLDQMNEEIEKASGPILKNRANTMFKKVSGMLDRTFNLLKELSNAPTSQKANSPDHSTATSEDPEFGDNG